MEKQMIDSIPVAIATTFANGSVVNSEYQPPTQCHQCSHRQWIGLTDEEIVRIWKPHMKDGTLEFAHAIEAKLKEKNT